MNVFPVTPKTDNKAVTGSQSDSANCLDMPEMGYPHGQKCLLTAYKFFLDNQPSTIIILGFGLWR